MSKRTYKLIFKASGRTALRDDHWIAYCDEFGISTYGTTYKEAEGRMVRALDLMMNRLAKRGANAVRARFTALGIPFLFEPLEPVQPIQVRRFERLEERELVMA